MDYAIYPLNRLLEVGIAGEVFDLDEFEKRRMLRASVFHVLTLGKRSCRSANFDASVQELVDYMSANEAYKSKCII